MQIESKINYILTLSDEELGVLKHALEMLKPLNEATRIIASNLLSDITEFEEGENA